MTSKCSRSWVVCLSAALFFFYVFIQMNFFTAIEPLLFNKFHVGSAGIATLTSMYFYGNVLCLFPAGLILDRFSTKIVLLIVTAISVIATVLFGFAHTFVQAELTRIVMGAVGAFCLLAPVRLASRWFPAERMALVVGVIVTMAMLGGMVAQTPFTLLADAVGLIKTIYVDVVIGVVIWLMILFLVDDVPSGSEKADQAQHHQLGSLGLIGSISKVLAVRQNWLAGLYASLVNLPIFLLGGFWGPGSNNPLRHEVMTTTPPATLLSKAQAVLQNAYCPYSQFAVAACVATPEGHLFSGCNVENAAYNLGTCAETNAISAMVSAGHTTVAQLLILVKGGVPCTPCGGCRQQLLEFATAETLVYLCCTTGNTQCYLAKELLPDAFNHRNLEHT